MPGGRPRKVCFSEEEMIALGEEMVQWVKEHPNTLHLSEWYTIEKMFLYREWKNFIQRKEFIPYYEQALKIVGRKYIDKNSNVRDGISQRWQRVYFPDLKEQEDDDKRFEASLSKEVNASANESVLKAYEAHKEQLDDIKKLHSSARKYADNKNNTDNKSA